MADISTAPGILSPEQVQQLVVEPLTRQSVATQVSTVVQTSSTSTRFPIVVADPTSGWTAEGSEIDVSDPDIEQKLVARGTFDAATELANHLPVTVVSSLIGLPEKGRERMLVWAEKMFNCFGPINDRTNASFSVLDEMLDYATNEAVPGKLKPNSWAAGIHDAVARGETGLS